MFCQHVINRDKTISLILSFKGRRIGHFDNIPLPINIDPSQIQKLPHSQARMQQQNNKLLRVGLLQNNPKKEREFSRF
jgi:hypothetical protein